MNKFHAGPRLSTFARLLLADWRRLKLPTVGEKLVVAVSGGADSTALLLAIEELIRARKLSVSILAAHLDHGIRPQSKEDARWVAKLAKGLGFISVTGRAQVAERAAATSENLEQAARTARYDFLERTAKRRDAHFVLTAHTMDDQAETVMLRLMRGSSGAGLGGMDVCRSISPRSQISLCRPLLWARRHQTEDYCAFRKTGFLQDEMNDDPRFARVRVRKQLLPLMESFNTKVVEALSRTATLLREDSSVLINDSDALLASAISTTSPGSETEIPPLSVNVLAKAPPALRRRALRQWISKGRGSSRRLEMVHLLAVEGLLAGNQGGKTVELPNGSKVTRRKGRLEFEA
jgi:tRNA(Ile)-lysidine synthase